MQDDCLDAVDLSDLARYRVYCLYTEPPLLSFCVLETVLLASPWHVLKAYNMDFVFRMEDYKDGFWVTLNFQNSTSGAGNSEVFDRVSARAAPVHHPSFVSFQEQHAAANSGVLCRMAAVKVCYENRKDPDALARDPVARFLFSVVCKPLQHSMFLRHFRGGV